LDQSDRYYFQYATVINDNEFNEQHNFKHVLPDLSCQFINYFARNIDFGIYENTGTNHSTNCSTRARAVGLRQRLRYEHHRNRGSSRRSGWRSVDRVCRVLSMEETRQKKRQS